MSTPSRPRRALLALALIAVLGTAACGGDGSKDAATTPPEATSTVPSGIEDSELEQPVGAVDMLSRFRCRPKDGVWRGTAKLTNTTDAKATFEVTFTVIETKGNAVVGEKTQTYDLAAGDSADVELTDLHDGDEDGLQCVRRVLKSS
ncbi:hypothetical protein AFL01nite_29660 [Aeromicrobium flavum]|uniref:Lipoprotein n=1 Tax=Aeromicrobium flavum TaxID=416568 RepID=A0A512HYW6_9ACTN|nr:hypothetical protein [Aeromicrobium flavum]GEO90639.1 hypothetical protein AFL01nite_29660 [Aeromicrobium flavum]